MPPIPGGGSSPAQLDRPPSLPPEVTPSTFTQLAGQTQAGAGPTAGDMQIKTLVGQLAMQIEMLSMKLGQLVPGSVQTVAQIQQLVRQLAITALTAGSAPAPMSPEMDMGALAGGDMMQGGVA